MLITRLITGLVLVVAVLGSVFFLPAWQRTALFIAVLIPASLEWAALAGLAGTPQRILYSFCVTALAVGAWRISLSGAALDLMLVLACGVWIAALLWIVSYQRNQGPRLDNCAVLVGLGAIVLVPAVVAIASLLLRGPAALLMLFGIVWGADIFAYFGGRQFGRSRLASHVSPGKSWAGVYSALLGTVIVGVAVNAWYYQAPVWMVVSLIGLTLVASVVGDLFESLLNRLRGL